jgi:hypothetical protein
MASEYRDDQVPSEGESYRLVRQADHDFEYENGPMVNETAVWNPGHTESENIFFTTNNTQGASLSPYESIASPAMTPVQGHHVVDTLHPYRHQPAKRYYKDQSVREESATNADASSGDGCWSARVRLDSVRRPLAGGYDNGMVGVDDTVWRDTVSMEMNGLGQPTALRVSHHPGWGGHGQAHSRVVAFGTVPDARQLVPICRSHVDAYGDLPYNQAQQLSGNPPLPHRNCPSDTNDAFSGRSVTPWSTYQVGRQKHQPSVDATISQYMRQVPASSSADSRDCQLEGNALTGLYNPTMIDSFNSDIQDLMQSRDTIRPDDILAKSRLQTSTSTFDHSNSGAALYGAASKGDVLEDDSYYDLCEDTDFLDSTVSDEYPVASSSA